MAEAFCIGVGFRGQERLSSIWTQRHVLSRNWRRELGWDWRWVQIAAFFFWLGIPSFDLHIPPFMKTEQRGHLFYSLHMYIIDYIRVVIY